MEVIRLCPQCKTERPTTEITCEGELDGGACSFYIADHPLQHAGAPYPQDVIPEPELHEEDSGYSTDATNSSTAAASSSSSFSCANGHPLVEGDFFCFACGTEAAAPRRESLTSPSTIVAGWRLIRELPCTSGAFDVFVVAREGEETAASNHEMVIFRADSEPDTSVYEVLPKLPEDLFCRLVEHGIDNNRYYEVWDGDSSTTLESIVDVVDWSHDNLSLLVAQLGQMLSILSSNNLRHRAICPANVVVQTESPLKVRLRGLSSAVVSQFDLDVAKPLHPNLYTAPEALVGGVAAASDWWALGLIVLVAVTKGRCFLDVNEPAWMMSVVTRGVVVPRDIDPRISSLLRGLLHRDPAKRWQWQEVERWLNDEVEPEAIDAEEDTELTKPTGPSIKLNDRNYFRPEDFALAATDASNWSQARELLLYGSVSTWLQKLGADSTLQASIGAIAKDELISEDTKLALALMSLNSHLPLCINGRIVNPLWLLENPEVGYELITGALIDKLELLNRERWLRELAYRAANIRKTIEALELIVDENRLKILLLSTSRQNLEMQWSQLRAIYPDSDHAGALWLIEKRRLSDEDLILLLSINSDLLTSKRHVLDQVQQASQIAGFSESGSDSVDELLRMSRPTLYEELEVRLEGFARCSNSVLDSWADTYRLEKRLELPRLIVLLRVPKESWKQPPKQQYVESILTFFQSKIVSSVMRGPLVKVRVGKSSTNIDVTELGGPLKTSKQILEHVLARTGQFVDIDTAEMDEVNPQLSGRLARLLQRTKMFSRDTGRHGLFLGYPFVVHRTSRVDEAKSSLRVAPLILWPVTLESTVRAGGPVRIAFEREREEARLNPALQAVLSLDARQLDKWKQVSDDILRTSSIRPENVLEAFGQLAPLQDKSLQVLPKDLPVPVGKSVVVGSAVLFNCDFAGKSIADDLRLIIEQPLANTALERLLRITTPNFQESIVSEDILVDNNTVIDADPSQLGAIVMARSPSGLHIEGPPGTGKSQTIVNVIADCAARGETVLVVCQKQAALSIVEKRLHAEGLSDRLFLISDVTKDREPTIKAVREQLENQNQIAWYAKNQQKRERERLVAKLKSLETELNEHYRAYFSSNPDIGLSYRNVLSELIEIEGSNAGFCSAALSLRQMLKGLADAKVFEIADNCGAIADVWLDSHFENSPLHVLSQFNVDHGIATSLPNLFASFVAAEEDRERVLQSAKAAFETTSSDEGRRWLDAHEERLLQLDSVTLVDLNRWISLFSSDRSEGESALEQLRLINQSLLALDEDKHTSQLFSGLVVQTSETLRALEPECKRASLQSMRQSPSADTVSARWTVARMTHSLGLKANRNDGSVQALADTLEKLHAAEIRREEAFSGSTDSFEIADSEATREWLSKHASSLAHMQADERSRLASWYGLLSGKANQTANGDDLIRELESLVLALNNIKDADEESELSAELFKLPSVQIKRIAIEARAAAPVGATTLSDDVKQKRWDFLESMRRLNLLEVFRRGPSEDNKALWDTFHSYQNSEEERERLLALPYPQVRLSDRSALVKWLEQNRGLFSTLDDQSRLTLKQLYNHNSADMANDDALTAAVLELRKLRERLVDHTEFCTPETTSIGRLLPSLEQQRLDTILSAAVLGTKPGTIFSSLNPSRWIARNRCKTFLKSINSLSSLELLKSLCELENEIRPLRKDLYKVAKRFNLKVERVGELDCEQLIEQVERSIENLEKVRSASQKLRDCPIHDQLGEFMKAISQESFDNFLATASHLLEVDKACEDSFTLLEKLRPWLPNSLLQSNLENIRAGAANVSALRSIQKLVHCYCQERFVRVAELLQPQAELSALRAELQRIFHVLDVQSNSYALAPTIVSHYENATTLFADLRKHRGLVTDLASCPHPAAAAEFACAPEQSFEFLSDRLNGACAHFETKRTSLSLLTDLEAGFEPAWLEGTRSLIENNQFDLARVKQSIELLPFTNDRFLGFLGAAVELELALKPLRRRLADCSASFAGLSSVGVLNVVDMRAAAANALTRVSAVSDAVFRVKQNPESKVAIALMAAGADNALLLFIQQFKVALNRCQAREMSEGLLDALQDWFEVDWLSKRRNLIANNSSSIQELRVIETELPRLKPFQIFRNRQRTFDALTVKTLAELRKNQQFFEELERDLLQRTVRNTVRHAACSMWKSLIEASEPSLSLADKEVNLKIDEIAECKTQLVQINRILLSEASPESISAAPLWAPLTKLRGARARRLREFIQEGAQLGLMKMRPIWLMNPEVASRVLPLQAGMFDRVIFDEASQLPVEFALPALFRAKIAIVSGDDKQMPPTNFFASKFDSDEDDDDDSQYDDAITESQKVAAEESWNRKEIKDCPDLLTLASAVLPSTRLEIHYRSEYRELIGFSNAAFYSNSLNVPARHADDEVRRAKPMEVVSVNGTYENQTNPDEAAQIVKTLHKIWLSTGGPLPTIGVVSFNKKQAELIYKTILEHAEKNPKFAYVFQEQELRREEGEDVGFFVKNLENVQGDERDIIIFSTTFGRNKSGLFRRAFGKLGQTGGERRLNVAVTRAKRKVIIVTSMPVGEISGYLTGNKPPSIPRDYLQAYLDYAAKVSQGNLQAADMALEKVVRGRRAKAQGNVNVDAFVADVRASVERLGYKVVSAASDSGAFGVDLAVVDTETGLFKLAIECDAPRHQLLSTAFYREVWRKWVLSKSIPNIHRISSKEWYQSKSRQEAALRKLLESIS